MNEPNLMLVSAAAFAAVLALLSLLAGIIRLLTALFPVVEELDAAVVAAISTAASRSYPGTRLGKIEEKP